MIGTSRSVWGFDPRSIPGCQLWLDAADSNTVTLSGSNVTQWRDKSGNGNNSTSSSATYTTGINGLGSMNNPTISGPITNSGSSIVDFFIVATLSATGSPYYNMLALNAASVVNFYAAGTLFACYYGGTNPPQFYSHMSGNLSLSSTGVVNKPYIFNAFQSGTSGTTVFNGTSQGAVTTPGNTFTYTNYYIGPVAIASAWLGNIGEILVFNSVLTTTQRQQIEGYLAHKWGLTGYYDSSIPLSIPGCQLWLDAADSSTLAFSSGSNVSSWADKSGNGNTVTQATTANQPTYVTNVVNGNPVIRFNGTTNILQKTSFTPLGTNSVSFWLVERNLSGGMSAAPFSFNSGPNAGIVFQNNNRLQPMSNVPYTSSVARIDFYNRTNTGSGDITYLNGNVSSTGDDNSTGTYGTTFAVGQRILSSIYTSGDICEILIFIGMPTTTQRQSIEGYLARKWGFTSMYSALPSTHPFSSIPPHLRVFQPIDVPGCQLWLDGADATTLTLSGNNVTQWNDKSGNARNLGVGSGTTSYSSNAIVLNSSYMFVNSPVNLTNVTVFIISKSTGGDNQSIFSARPQTSADYNSYDGFGFFMDYQSAVRFYGHLGAGRLSVFSVNTSTPQIFSFQSSGTSISAWHNGVSQSGGTLSSTRTSTAQGFIIGASWDGSVYENIVASASIYEILVYNTALTTSQRQQVEGYLAHKWGLTPSLPVISPLSIPGCQLWLDGADNSSLGLSGSNVTQWNDKSGRGNNLTAVSGYANATVSFAYQNGLNVINFSGNGLYRTIANWTVYPQDVYIVIALKSTTAHVDVLGMGHTRSDYFNSLTFGEYTASRWHNGSSGFNRTPNCVSPTNETSTSFLLIQWSIANNNFLIRRNGSDLVQTNSYTYALPGDSVFQIGFRHTDRNGANFSGYIGEILVYNTQIATTQRQQIEGYLARKWGISISATLPSPHPFKSIPPASLPFSPRNISGLQLWLDAADQGSMTLSGSSVTQWRDKSGNGNNSTSSSATYTTGINGLGSMNNPTISGPITNSGSSTVTIFVVASNNRTGNSYDNMIALNVSPVTNYYASGSLFLTRHGDLTNPQVFYAFMNGFPNGDLSFSFNTPFNTPFIFNIFQSGTVGSTYGNGTSYGDVNTRGATFNYTHYYIGTCTGGPAWIGNIGEVIIYNSALTTSQRQQVEGYLAQKWGLTGSLPSSHPFKKLPA